MKPRNVSVSIIQSGDTIKIWCSTFTLKGHLPTKADGSIDEKARKAKQKEIARVLETLEFPNEVSSDGSNED